MLTVSRDLPVIISAANHNSLYLNQGSHKNVFIAFFIASLVYAKEINQKCCIMSMRVKIGAQCCCVIYISIYINTLTYPHRYVVVCGFLFLTEV